MEEAHSIVYRPPAKDDIIREREQEIRALHASLAFHQEKNARLALANDELITLAGDVTRQELLSIIETLPNIPQKTQLKRVLWRLPVNEKQIKSQVEE